MCPYAAVVELADTPALGAGTRKGVKVQVLSAAPVFRNQKISLRRFEMNNASKKMCLFCGHPKKDHETTALFNQYRKTFVDIDKAWNKLKEDHPKLAKCRGFSPED